MSTAQVAHLPGKCERCVRSICCTYVTQKIDAPRSIMDFDFLLWQVAHHGIRAFQDETGWYLQIDTRCSHLQPDGRCGIYEKRPQICREYSNDWCEFDEPAEKHWKRHFPDYDSLDAYCRKRFKNWDKRHEA